MSHIITLKDILLDNNWFPVCAYSITHILWNSRKLYITSSICKIFICQIINGLNLFQLQRAILIQRIPLIVYIAFH